MIIALPAKMFLIFIPLWAARWLEKKTLPTGGKI